jgi:DNA-binding CsgD family transcriptional regulator/PAS domain-containing protein
MRSSSPKSIIKLIGEIYDCVGRDRESWQNVYKKLSRMMHSESGSIHLYNPSTATFEPLADTNPPDFKQNFRDIYFDLLPFRSELLSLAEGDILIRSKVISDARWERSVLWREHFSKLGIYHVLHHYLVDQGRLGAGITFTRPKERRDFSRDDIASYQQFAPHLQRAVRLHIDLMQRNSRTKVYEDAWDRSPQAIAVTDENGRVQFCNRSAKQMLQRGPLRIDGTNSLVASDARNTEQIRTAVREVLSMPDADRNHASLQLTIRSEYGKNRVSMLIAPYLNNYGTDHPIDKLAVIVLCDPHNKDESLEHDLASAYGLTPSESRIALSIASGNSLADIGKQLNITTNTVRTHLKRVFHKTETNRQAELVKLVLNTPRFISEKIIGNNPNG